MHSMTGFGRAEYASQHLIARVELSSVNRKQGEVIVQIPRAHAELDATIKKLILGRLSRGRINVSITIEQTRETATPLKVDLVKAKALSDAFQKIEQHIGQPCALTPSDYLRTEDIILFEEENLSTDKAWETIQPALEQALEKLIAMRAAEGTDLQQDIRHRINLLEDLTTRIEQHAPSVVQRHRENLLKRLRDINLELDPSDERVIKEIAIFAERCDITEETTRLRAHFNRFKDYLYASEPTGRSLDFLCQELNRELNTIGSKANDSSLAQHVVTGKTELEKIREQIQNVE